MTDARKTQGWRPNPGLEFANAFGVQRFVQSQVLIDRPMSFTTNSAWLKFSGESKLPAMLNDLAYAFRTLRRSPIFTITVVVTIALAIGASTAIFSVTNGVLLRKLPYKDPERLVLARGDLQKRNVKDFPLSNADYLDLRNGAKNNFDDFAAVSTFRFTMPGLDGTPERVRVGLSID